MLFCETAAVFELDNIRSATIFARRPHFLNLTTSKMEPFCETLSIFEAGNIKNEAILRDFLQKWKVECRADGLVPMRFGLFDSICLKYCACHEKVMPGHTVIRSAAPVTQIILANLKIWCSKLQPLSENQRPDLLTYLMNMSLVLRMPRKMYLARCSSNAPRLPRLPSFLKQRQNLTFCSLLTSAQSLAPATQNDIWTSKSRPNMLFFQHVDFEMCFAPQRRAVCFVHFDVEMCFAPQRCALFRHFNFQKWSEREVL